jgi:hypothetical protein
LHNFNKKIMKLSINESIEWLNANTVENFSRSRFYRLRQREIFEGFWRPDKDIYYFTCTCLKRGCRELGIAYQKPTRKNKRGKRK